MKVLGAKGLFVTTLPFRRSPVLLSPFEALLGDRPVVAPEGRRLDTWLMGVGTGQYQLGRSRVGS